MSISPVVACVGAALFGIRNRKDTCAYTVKIGLVLVVISGNFVFRKLVAFVFLIPCEVLTDNVVALKKRCV